MNTALSVLSIRHHHLSPPPPLSHTLPFHATIHKQSFIILIPSSPYLFSACNVGASVLCVPLFWCTSLSCTPWSYCKTVDTFIYFYIKGIKSGFFSHRGVGQALIFTFWATELMFFTHTHTKKILFSFCKCHISYLETYGQAYCPPPPATGRLYSK